MASNARLHPIVPPASHEDHSFSTDSTLSAGAARLRTP
jgi:hypothetical protein